MEGIFESNILNLAVVWFVLFRLLKEPIIRAIDAYIEKLRVDRLEIEKSFLAAKVATASDFEFKVRRQVERKKEIKFALKKIFASY